MKTSSKNNDDKHHGTTDDEEGNQASLQQTLSFVFGCGGVRVRMVFLVGVVAAVLNGCVYPALAYVFSTTFSQLSAASFDGTQSMGQVVDATLLFVYVGAYGFVVALTQAWCFESCGHVGTQQLQKQWFQALLRQDQSWYDVNDIKGIASQIAPSAAKYRRGVGRRFGEGVQWTVTAFGGIAYAFYSCWQVALLILACIPILAGATYAVLKMNQSKGECRDAYNCLVKMESGGMDF